MGLLPVRLVHHDVSPRDVLQGRGVLHQQLEAREQHLEKVLAVSEVMFSGFEVFDPNADLTGPPHALPKRGLYEALLPDHLPNPGGGKLLFSLLC